MKVLATLTLALAISYVHADGPHVHEHAPAPVHDTGYGAPEPAYGAPDTGYGAPEHPDTGYGAPVHDHYEPTPYEHHEVYHEEEFPDLTPFIVAIIVITGLSLLFPTHVNIPDINVNAGRKKRYAEDIESSDFIGRSIQIYDHLNMALEPIDRGCLEKITCEVGGLAYDSGLTSSPLLQLVVPFVPGKYGRFMKHFVYAENCHKIKCSAYP